MQEPIASQKENQRKVYKQIRRSLGEEYREVASRAICSKITDWSVFHLADVILTYLPIKFEVDLSTLLPNAETRKSDTMPFPRSLTEKKWVIPRINEFDHTMFFHLYDPDQLIRHPLGMDEPDPLTPVIAPEQIQLALVPGLAFDQSGGRLGYGGGYFDRFLAGFSGISLGVTYDALFVPTLPRGEFDIPVQFVMTETRFENIGLGEITST